MSQIIKWDEFRNDVRILSNQIKDSQIRYDVIVSISTGGLYSAGLLSKLLDIPKILNISCESYNENNERGEIIFYNKLHPEDIKDASRVLIVDDLIDSGNTIKAVTEHISNISMPMTSVDIACPYVKSSYEDTNPVYFVVTIDKDIWLKFPWE